MRRWLGVVPLRAWVLAVVLLSWLGAGWLHLDGIERSPAYSVATSLLLAVGLFGSTFGIDLRQARADRQLIVSAVTVGVLLKAVLIGGVLFAATRDPLFLVLGVAVAQIDPLSVAALLGDARLSARAQAVLSSWASFDDPVTVILAVYAAALATGSFGLSSAAGPRPTVAAAVSTYGLDLALNLLVAGLAYVAWRTLRRWPWLMGGVLVVLAAVAVWQFLMLAVALAGLFIRPPGLATVMARLATGALVVAGALLGVLLVGGVSLGYGVALGLLAFAAQVVVGTLLTRGLPRIDRIHLALAQQNGITAVILALRLEVRYVGAVAVIAPAILVTNVVYVVTNWLVDRHRPGDGGTGYPVS